MSALVIALPILTVLAVALVGSTRRLGFWLTLLCAVVLTPLGGFVVAAISGPRRHRATAQPVPEPG